MDRRDVITVIAHYRTTPEAAEDVSRLLAQHARMSEAEPGCQCFLVHQSTDDAARFALYEVYDDLEAFEAHRNTAHFRVNIEQTLVPLLLERKWRVYGPAI
jgi:quinol monooxygenase YgiN